MTFEEWLPEEIEALRRAVLFPDVVFFTEKQLKEWGYLPRKKGGDNDGR